MVGQARTQANLLAEDATIILLSELARGAKNAEDALEAAFRIAQNARWRARLYTTSLTAPTRSDSRSRAFEYITDVEGARIFSKRK